MTSPLRVCLVSPLMGGHPARVTSQAEVQARLFSGPDLEVRATSPVANRPGRLVDVVASLVRWRHQVDVVVVSVFSGAGFVVADVASRLCRRLGLPVVLTLRGGGLPAFRSRHPQWVAAVLGRAAAVTAPSGYLLRALAADVRVPTATVPQALDLDAYVFQPRSALRPRLLWMRAFAPEYRPELAVDVLARLAADVPDARLTMAGQAGPALRATRQRARALAVGHRVDMAGFLGPAEKRAALAAHDVFVSTSGVDNAPVTALEAAASGVPIVAFAVGGLPYLFEHGRTALLVDGGDVGAMAAAVRRLLSEPATAARLSSQALRTAEGSDAPVVRDRWRQVLEEAVAAHARS